MVSLTTVTSSNSLISSTLPPGLIALFVGATSGIGEITLKKFARYTHRPHAYFVGRSQDAADRIMKECTALNSSGEYTFIKADVSLIRIVDEVCKDIKAKEKTLNLLFLSSGIPSFDRSQTSEKLHLLAALNYYSRLRFVTNLLPLIQHAPSLRRIITVGGGTQERPLDTTDFQALKIPLPQLRGHLTSLITLGFEAVARTAPEVSFVHDYPGTVRTPFLNYLSDEQLKIYESQMVEVDESGERHLFLATSQRYPSKNDGEDATLVDENGEVAVGTTGKVGSGVYSVGPDCESARPEVLELLSGLREKGLVEEVWKHTEAEYERITGANERA